MTAPRVVVVGGGITGLAAAYYLQKFSEGKAHVTLVEASPRLGGAIETFHEGGALLEGGPDSFLSAKPHAAALCEELSLGGEILPTSPRHRRSFIVRNGKLVPVPEGFYLLAPASWRALAAMPIFGLAGKLRMACEWFIPPRREDADESLASFVRRRFGAEALVRFAQPMAAGIFTADPEKLSLRAAFPQFAEMERKHGSVLRALMAGAHRNPPAGTQGAKSAGGPRYSLFMTLRGGLQTLTNRLAEKIRRGGGEILTSALVENLARSEGEGRGEWKISTAEGKSLEADAVVLALPAFRSAELLAETDAALAGELRRIEYASCATVNVLARRGDVAHPLDGMGFVVPSVEGRAVLACSFSSVKFEGRAPEGTVLMRAFVGGASQPERFADSDREMRRRVLSDLHDLVGFSGEPLHVGIRRHERAMPQYHVGHETLVTQIEALAARHESLALAGNAYHGVGIPDCVRSAEEAGRKIFPDFRAERQ